MGARPGVARHRSAGAARRTPGARRGAGRGFWLRGGVGGTEGCAQGACRDGSSWRSSWVQGFTCILSAAATSQVGGVGFIAVLGQPLSPVRQQRDGRDAGGWGAQGCLGILYTEVMSPRGVLPLGMRAGAAGVTLPPCPRSSREGDFAGEGLAPSLPTLRALQQDADPGGPR